jgi:hypothetical protein
MLVLAHFLLGLPAGQAEEAIHADGRRLAGSLAVDDRGRLVFAVPGRPEPVDVESLAQVRLADANPPPFRIAAGHRVLLRSGEVLSGQLLALDGETVVLRTAWADRLALPRAAVAAVTQLPGWQTLFVDDFTGGLEAWSSSGQPALGDEKAGPALLLARPGQALAWAPAVPLTAGRVGVNFQERDGAAGARWLLEAQFGDGKQPRLLRVTLAGTDGYPVEGVGLEGTAGAAGRTPGWHRLTVQFTPRSLRVLCDDAVLWYNLDRGPGGPLLRVRLRCQEAPDAPPTRGAVALAAFSAARAVDEAVRPPADPGQDEVWLASGDQLFGTIGKGDGRAVEVQGRFGRRSLPWSQLRGCYLRRAEQPPTAAAGTVVRLSLRSGLGGEPDLLDGVVLGLDERRLRLRHALLGEVSVERGRVRGLRPAGK